MYTAYLGGIYFVQMSTQQIYKIYHIGSFGIQMEYWSEKNPLDLLGGVRGKVTIWKSTRVLCSS